MVTSRVDALDLLTRGAITVKGRMPWSSNAIFLVQVTLESATALGVYKPGRGERPLWDFPPGLFKREVAAYFLSEALGWGLVPPTVRREGPLGEGSLQRFVPADVEQHYFTLREDRAHHARLRRICLFDLVANNADRKSGHCLLAPDGVIYAIDNALTFHAEPKLRTVIWEFGGEPIPEAMLADVRRLLVAGLPAPLSALLDPAEQEALLVRARAIVGEGRFPVDTTGWRYPWPLV
ncbi:MAG: SCO1664 family protein [Candidatus Rokubacteria bacterium]|nr:SCO1664 family protein [Candidatus Rokubacteria bacterium]